MVNAGNATVLVVTESGNVTVFSGSRSIRTPLWGFSYRVLSQMEQRWYRDEGCKLMKA